MIDQLLDSSPLLLFDAHHAPKTTGLSDVATGFGDDGRFLVFVDPLVNLLAALCEQTPKVFGLAVIRCSRRSNAVIDSIGRPVHGHRRHGLAVTEVDRPGAMLSDGPQTFRPLRVRHLSTAPIRVRGDWGFGVWRGQAIARRIDWHHVRPR